MAGAVRIDRLGLLRVRGRPPDSFAGRGAALVSGLVFLFLGGAPLVTILATLRHRSRRATFLGLPGAVARRLEERFGPDPAVARIVARGCGIAIVSACTLGVLAGVWLHRSLL